MVRIKGCCHPSISLPSGEPHVSPSAQRLWGGGFKGGDKWGLPRWGLTHPHTSSGDLLGRAEALGWGLG